MKKIERVLKEYNKQRDNFNDVEKEVCLSNHESQLPKIEFNLDAEKFFLEDVDGEISLAIPEAKKLYDYFKKIFEEESPLEEN
jgi:hypothetical protein